MQKSLISEYVTNLKKWKKTRTWNDYCLFTKAKKRNWDEFSHMESEKEKTSKIKKVQVYKLNLKSYNIYISYLKPSYLY